MSIIVTTNLTNEYFPLFALICFITVATLQCCVSPADNKITELHLNYSYCWEEKYKLISISGSAHLIPHNCSYGVSALVGERESQPSQWVDIPVPPRLDQSHHLQSVSQHNLSTTFSLTKGGNNQNCKVRQTLQLILQYLDDKVATKIKLQLNITWLQVCAKIHSAERIKTH